MHQRYAQRTNDGSTGSGHHRPDLENDPKQLPVSEIFNYQRKAPGSSVAAVSIAKDPAATTALYTVASVSASASCFEHTVIV